MTGLPPLLRHCRIETPAGPDLLVDLFAGGGGASTGMELALDRPVDYAINHDPVAVAMHKANHPHTVHFREDVWRVPPTHVTQGRPVGALWASPDCTHFSKAKGAAPTRDAKRRDLAWAVIRWMQEVRPTVVYLENVEEFRSWGPLDCRGGVIEERKGDTFRAWARQVRRLGYRMECRELRACDYGAPTTRKRLFIIMRRDDRPIVWPEPTHGPGRAHPWRTAAEIIDWSLPCPSIFMTQEEARALGLNVRRPLAENTMRRIFAGVRRYVLEAAEPFLVSYYSQDAFRGQGLDDPLRTISTENRFAVVAPTMIQTGYGERKGQAPRVPGLDKPLGTVVAGGCKHALVSAWIAKHYSGVVDSGARDPLSTVTTTDHNALVAAHIQRDFGHSVGHGCEVPMGTVTGGGGGKSALVTSHLSKLYGTCRHGQAGGNHVAEVRAFLIKYFGTAVGQGLDDPLHTVTSKPRFGVVMVHGEPYQIMDIGMRMLSPRELFRAQGFGDDYVIDVEVDGKPISKAAQVRCAGNTVCPDMGEALVRANSRVEVGA